MERIFLVLFKMTIIFVKVLFGKPKIYQMEGSVLQSVLGRYSPRDFGAKVDQDVIWLHVIVNIALIVESR